MSKVSKFSQWETPTEIHHPEPRYADLDEDEINERKRPKWMSPETPLERKLFSLYGRLYYARNEKELRHQILMIGKSTGSMMSGAICQYPTEYIDNCIGWVNTSKLNGRFIPLKGLVSAILNPINRERFLATWGQKKESE
jgi:hypothetical protein